MELISVKDPLGEPFYIWIEPEWKGRKSLVINDLCTVNGYMNEDDTIPIEYSLN